MGGFWANAASHWWIILLIVILIFGATKLPQLAKGIGQSVRILRKEVKDDSDDTTASTTDGTGAGADSSADPK